MKARVKRVQVNAEVFFHIMREGTSWKVIEGIPVNAKMRGAVLDPYTQTLNLFVEHDSFELVDIYSPFPLLVTEFEKIK